MIVLDIIGWAFMIASWSLPEKWFDDRLKMYGARLICAGVAFVLFTTSILVGLIG
jgi:hypothetical protein